MVPSAVTGPGRRGSGPPPAAALRGVSRPRLAPRWMYGRRLAFASAILASAGAGMPRAAEQGVFPAADGFELPYVLERPVRRPEGPERVVVMIHGSGPHGMDMDLSAVSERGTDNRLFVVISRSLTLKGFTVARYDKRSYVALARLKADPSFARTEAFTAYAANPLEHFVGDVRALVRHLREEVPGARVHLFGLSQGAYLGLQVAAEDPDIAGVALMGYSHQTLDTTMLEQTVYRHLGRFERLDADRDGAIVLKEARRAGDEGMTLWTQVGVLDLDGDGRIDRSEYMAGQASNLVPDSADLAAYRRQEAAYPRLGAILASLACPVLFFQGEWDNQTPSYNAKAVQMVNNVGWKKPNLHFFYFDKLGHVLDPRSSRDDLTYRPIDKKALRTMVDAMDDLFR